MASDPRLQERSLEELREISLKLSRQIIEITTRAGSGHPSSSLSAIDILAVLYFGGVMRYDICASWMALERRPVRSVKDSLSALDMRWQPAWTGATTASTS